MSLLLEFKNKTKDNTNYPEGGGGGGTVQAHTAWTWPNTSHKNIHNQREQDREYREG